MKDDEFKKVSDCCEFYVYYDIIERNEAIRLQEEHGMIPGKDFIFLREYPMCASCRKPCKEISVGREA